MLIRFNSLRRWEENLRGPRRVWFCRVDATEKNESNLYEFHQVIYPSACSKGNNMSQSEFNCKIVADKIDFPLADKSENI